MRISKISTLFSLVLLSVMILFMASCSKSKDSPAPDPDDSGDSEATYDFSKYGNPTVIRPSEQEGETGRELNYVQVQDLKANPQIRNDDGEVIDQGNNQYTLFRFSDGVIIPNSDSASGNWDIGFRSTNIILNGGVNGPGEVEGQVVKDIFEDLAKAPADKYRQDNEDGNVFSDWYNYNSSIHVITPEPGYLQVIHTQDDKYVKVEIESYYKGDPSDLGTNEGLESSYYTFRYFIQQDGSTSFAKK